MKMIKDLKYFMEAPMHDAFPRYSAILLALAFSIPAFAQEVEDIDLEEETAAVETAEALLNRERRLRRPHLFQSRVLSAVLHPSDPPIDSH